MRELEMHVDLERPSECSSHSFNSLPFRLLSSILTIGEKLNAPGRWFHQLHNHLAGRRFPAPSHQPDRAFPLLSEKTDIIYCFDMTDDFLENALLNGKVFLQVLYFEQGLFAHALHLLLLVKPAAH